MVLTLWTTASTGRSSKTSALATCPADSGCPKLGRTSTFRTHTELDKASTSTNAELLPMDRVCGMHAANLSTHLSSGLDESIALSKRPRHWPIAGYRQCGL